MLELGKHSCLDRIGFETLQAVIISPSLYFSKGAFINTSYLTDSYIVFTLKMESVSEITIFGLNKKVSEKWSRKNIFEKPPCGSHFLLIHFTS